MKRLLICALAVVSGIMAFAQTSSERVASATLSNNRVTAIAQDSRGHIWLGTFRGLNRYDSHEFHQYFCSSNDNTGLPDNQIQCLHSDRSGRLWIGTVNGICRYRDDDSFDYIPIYGVKSYNIVQILESRSGKILINTADAISLYNAESGCFESRLAVYSNDWQYLLGAFISPDDRLWVFGDRLYCYNIDSFRLEASFELTSGNPTAGCMYPDGNIWFSTDKGLSIFSTGSESFIPLPQQLASDKAFASSFISQIFCIGGKILFITDSRDAFAYNPNDGSFTRRSEPDFDFDIPDFKLNTVFEDSEKNIWWCSYDQGYKISYAYKVKFGNNVLNAGLGGKSVTAMDIIGGTMYFSTLCDGIYEYDIDGGLLTHLKEKGAIDKKDKIFISSLRAAPDGKLWIGSGSKVFLCQIRKASLEVLKFWNCPWTLCMKADSEGNLWVGTASGLMLRISADGSRTDYINLGISEKSYTFVGGIEFLPNGNIVAAAFREGLFEIDRVSLKVKKYEIPLEDWEKCIARSVFIPSCMKIDRGGTIWIGTVANGLLKYDPPSGSLTPLPGTPCNDICSIEEDEQGNLWISTQNGLAKYDRTVGRFINWFEADGIGGNQFYDRASAMIDSGVLVFGGTHGVTLFNPVEVMSHRRVPLLFEGLKVHNGTIVPSEGGCIAKAMAFNPEVRLKYDQNSFAISFSALDYSEYERVRYSYMLEGYDKYWVDASSGREANYANVPSGKYIFKVRITNIEQTEVLAENSLDLSVERPLYRSWWAYTLYIIFAIAILCIIVVYRRKFNEEREAKKKAAMEREQEKKVNEMNMSFFANISHEFRTPLTMISGPVAQLSESPAIDENGKRLLEIVRRNIERMQRLVNQLLDFNKMENDSLKLKVRNIDVVSLLNYLVEIFRVSANEKGISLVTWGIEDSLSAWADDDKLDKICFNLLSNAMKFTSQGGKVEISLDCLTRDDARKLFGDCMQYNDSKYLKITVKDTGPGIPEDQLEKIFERYYQLDNNVRGAYNWGTGIGLYYARTLAAMHHGWLKAANRNDGLQGAMFILLLPASESAYSEAEKAKDGDYIRKKAVQVTRIQEDVNPDEQKATVLIVDDDTDIIRYMKELLSTRYNVIYRYDADSAFLSVKKDAPDIVISDVMMPGRSGYELCRDIKGSLQLSHIPVILLTAKANVDDQVQGLDCGADAYVTKPFEPQYLMALVNSQIKNREKIKALLSQATEVSALDDNVLSEQDNAFMKDLYALMERELSNDELDVTGMTERLHISRTKFYYKVKGLTGENPSVFFKRYKLNRAAQLLKEHKYNISEIADMTGFSTLSHFSTSFKKQFGVSPSEFNK
ncbi:MAG: two-component regulator propeller domain-containing protein [Candidatus Cryptobacteroides sp.]